MNPDEPFLQSPSFDEERKLAEVLIRIFSLSPDLVDREKPDAAAGQDLLSALQHALGIQIARLAADDPEHLFRLLYRIDVDERIAHKALASGQHHALAGAILSRLVEKFHTRRQLNFDDGPGDW